MVFEMLERFLISTLEDNQNLVNLVVAEVDSMIQSAPKYLGVEALCGYTLV